MSPEQASMGATDIDTRSDIFSLGIILYELLTGSTPLDDSSLKEEAALKVLEMIREKEAILPSKKLLSSTVHDSNSVSHLRRTDSVRLTRVLRGELDWIVMKSLEKDRSRRYETAAAFAEDVHRYMSCQPILARPPSWHYQTSKFIRRNRLAVVTSSLIILSLLAAVFIAGWGVREARIALAKQQVALDEAQGVSDFWNHLLLQAQPDALGSNLRVIDAVENRRRELLPEKSLSPQRKSHFLSLLLDLYIQFQDIDSANRVAIDLNAILKIDKSLDEKDRLVANSHLASVTWMNGDLDKATQELERIVEPMRRVLGPFSADYLSTYQNLALMFTQIGKADQAEKILREIISSPGELPTEGLLMAKTNLAILLTKTDRVQEGLKLLRSNLAEAERQLGNHHTTTLFICQTLGSSSSDGEEVLRLLTRATESYTQLFGALSDRSILSRKELLGALGNLQRWQEVIPQANTLREFFDQKQANLPNEEFGQKYKGERMETNKIYFFALVEDRQYELASQLLPEWINGELAKQPEKEKFLYRWLLSKSYLRLRELSSVAVELSKMNETTELGTVETFELDLVNLELAMRQTVASSKEDSAEVPSDRFKKIGKVFDDLQVESKLNRMFEQAAPENNLMRPILQRDVAECLSFYYASIGNLNESVEWQKKGNRK